MASGVGRVAGSSLGTAAARMAVRVPPGLTALTRIPSSLSSSARTWVSPSRPNLETAYAPQPFRPPPPPPQPPRHNLQGPRPAGAEHEGRSLAPEGCRHRLPDPLARAGDEGHAPGEQSGHHTP